MTKDSPKKLISIVIPVFNEERNVNLIYQEVCRVLDPLASTYSYEMIFVDDGSTDRSAKEIEKLEQEHPDIVWGIYFSRNFGKELATSAGFHEARGDAAIAIDSDLQHPTEVILKFLKRWESGADVVIGVRKESKSDSWVKRQGGKWFYRILNAISETKTIPHSTDFRLLDRLVLNEFNKIKEHNRITRGIVDWLGFNQSYVYFDAKERLHGEPSYNIFKLLKLAVAGFISHSLFPLRFAAYAGLVIMLLSGVLGLVMFLERYVFAWSFNFSGPAILADIILFLVGLILVCIGLLAFYIGNIYHNTRERPLYVIKKNKHKR